MGAPYKNRNRGNGNQRTYEKNGNSSGGGVRRRGNMGVIVVVSLVLIIAAAAVLYLLKGNKPTTADPGKESGMSDRDLLASDKFYEGISVDGIPLGGLTRGEAIQKIKDKQKQTVKETGVTVVYDANSKWPLMLSDLPESAYGFNTDAVLDEAFKLGRDQATDSERLAYIKQLPANPVTLMTKAIVKDCSSLESKVRDLTTPYYVAPVNAAYVPGKYDPSKEGVERLTFSPEASGSQVDPDKLWAAVKEALESGAFGIVQMNMEPIPPSVTVTMIQADMQLMHVENIKGSNAAETKRLNAANEGHTFTTRIFDHSDGRLKNIELAGNGVSGLVLPGEVFDFNARTGPRTEEQGYQIANVDISGIVDQGLGGGVCQVSGTAYNAVIRYGGKYESDDKASTKGQPGLAVTSRDNHSVPSAYLLPGTDATVDTKSGKNFTFRNDFSKPVLIVLYYEVDTKGYYYEHCDIYGPKLPDGAVYNLVAKNKKPLEVDPNAPYEIRYSKYAKRGNPVFKNGRDGFTIDVFIEKTLNGATTSYKIYADRCNPQPPYWYIYPGESAPLATATPSPAPEVTAEPPPTTPPPTDGT